MVLPGDRPRLPEIIGSSTTGILPDSGGDRHDAGVLYGFGLPRVAATTITSELAGTVRLVTVFARFRANVY